MSQMIIDEDKSSHLKKLAEEEAETIIQTIRQKVEDVSYTAVSQNYDGYDEDDTEQLKNVFQEYLYEYIHENL